MTCIQWQSGIHLLTASIYPSLNAYRWMRTTWLRSWQSSQDERRFLSAVRADDFLKRHFSKTSFFNSVLFLFCDLPPTSVLLKSPFSFCTFPQGSFLVTFFFFLGGGTVSALKTFISGCFQNQSRASRKPEPATGQPCFVPCGRKMLFWEGDSPLHSSLMTAAMLN